MLRVAVACLVGLLAGCTAEPYGPGTVRLALPDGQIFTGRYLPVTVVGFPPGPPVTYGMGAEGVVTRQQALLTGPHGDVIVCRFGAAAAESAEIVCQQPDGTLLNATLQPPERYGPW